MSSFIEQINKLLYSENRPADCACDENKHSSLFWREMNENDSKGFVA